MITLAFFNNKGGVGKTTLVYHLGFMMAEMGRRVLMVDLDPQSNLTAMCLSEERLESLWPNTVDHPESVLGCVRPILRGIGDIGAPHTEVIDDGLALVPGDLGLSTFEDKLSDSWPRALDRDESAFRTLSAFHRLTRQAAEVIGAHVVLMDVGPNLGAINRAALLACDYVITPLAPDLFSVQGLRNLGPTLADWRRGWTDRLSRNPAYDLDLPQGLMEPLGYVVMQAGMRLSRPVKAYQRWVNRMPTEFVQSMIGTGDAPATFADDPSCLGVMRHYQSLMPLAQDAQKPMFRLRPGDGAIGAHVDAVQRCRLDFETLANRILSKIDERRPELALSTS
ncbi:MAG: ParA family protein [Myxococcales bacterium]|nr:ParA family protein [Myxococcales bacterium]